MNTCLSKCACGLVAGLACLSWLTGCSPIDSFKPEVIRIDEGEITIKGWVDEKKSRFCIKIELKDQRETVSLHSLNVVRPDGTKAAPHDWKDQTPRSAPPRVSLGFGIGLGGRSGGSRHHGEGHHSGGGLGTVLTPGVSFPLQKEKSTKSITKVTACWTLRSLKSDDVSKCDMEINLASMSRDKITITTVTLAMAHHEDKDDEPKVATAPPPKEEKKQENQTAKDLISEIDFTQKGPVKTKSLEV
ncbi:MAG: hypothetical protein HN350_08950 [Phycisphaerales bacterium]|jgi:hypothetical protein|nr:hypothetical protein [Phycisphaerales bacterium]